MNAIVMNTLTGAVSEYDSFGFDTITATHAGSEDGLYLLDGGTDDGAIITSTVLSGKTLMGTAQKKRLSSIYFSVRGAGDGQCVVAGENSAHTYPFPIRPTGESRATPGKGIRENYLAFGFSNSAGADFVLDQIEADVVPVAVRRI